MYRRIIKCAMLCLCARAMARAQEFKLWDRAIQVHGFVSQGFVYTDQNNWLTMNSSQGSAAMTDMGLNMSSQLTDKLLVGAQVYDRNLGQLGQYHPSLDWAVADYRFKPWLGVRTGKVKTTLGLFNDSQDLDFLRVCALLPQGMYATDVRDTTIAHLGGDLYGNLSVPRRLGDISYTAYLGRHSDSIYSGYIYVVTQWGVDLRSYGGLEYGGDLRWNLPVKGLTIGISRMNQQATGKGSFLNLLDPAAGIEPYQTTTKQFWINQFYGEYTLHKLRFDGEYRRYFDITPYIPGSDSILDDRAWYVAGAYQLRKRFALGSYYSHYTNTYLLDGLAGTMIPSQLDTSLPRNHEYDKVVSSRFDFNRFAYLKIEGHFINGYGIGPYPNGFYPQQNRRGFNPNTNALVLKTGFHF